MYDLIVIGGGPAGLAAACAAWEAGLHRVLIVERDRELGGILNQCIHNGFGLHYFKEELTGPEYAGRFVNMLRDTGVEVRLDTMVLEVGADRRVHMVGKATGYRVEEARSVLLAMGCRERTRGAISIPGTRPAGIFTAGAAQRYVNMEGWLPGERVVILGSGDIGLIMARRMTLEGAKVLACVEVMPYSGGLNRNIVQCLHDYDIPLYLSHTVTEIRGKNRVEQVVVSKVDEQRRPIPGSEMIFDCDTLLLSVGLIPENELTRQAGIAIDPRTSGAVVYENMETSLPGCSPAAMWPTFTIWWTLSPPRASGPGGPPPAMCWRGRAQRSPHWRWSAGTASPTQCPSTSAQAGWSRGASSFSGSTGCAGPAGLQSPAAAASWPPSAGTAWPPARWNTSPCPGHCWIRPMEPLPLPSRR